MPERIVISGRFVYTWMGRGIESFVNFRVEDECKEKTTITNDEFDWLLPPNARRGVSPHVIHDKVAPGPARGIPPHNGPCLDGRAEYLGEVTDLTPQPLSVDGGGETWLPAPMRLRKKGLRRDKRKVKANG